MSRFAALLTAMLLLCLGAVAFPVHAQEPPQQGSKEDSPVSPLLRQFIEQRDASAAQSDAQSEISAVTRSQLGDGLLTKGLPTRDAPASGSGQPETGNRDDPVRFDDSGNVQVYIHLRKTSDEVLLQLRDLDATIEIANSDWNLVQAWVPIAVLYRIAALDAVRKVTPPDYAVTNAGSVTTEGDAAHRADLVRSLSGLTGAGVKVGVISVGADSYRRSISSGDLPEAVEINPNSKGTGDDGTAMMEIVHDLAPGARLAFSGLSTETSLDMVEAILWLANDAFDGEGAGIIVDDITFYDQPYFEDGHLAEAAADAVSGGVVLVSSAGNTAGQHYEARFSDGGDGFHDFDASDKTDIALRIYLLVGVSVSLQWNDRFGESGNDYDLFVCERWRKPTKVNLQNGVCKGSTEVQDGDDDPIEVVHFTGTGEADIYIRKHSGDARTLELLARGSRIIFPEHGVPEGSIFGHAAVDGVLAVGAIDVSDPGNDDPESFSSRGPSEIYFPSRETRSKPDVMGIDGVSTTGPGGRFNPFFGTSAAAPHVAGIAALVMEAQRSATPSATRKVIAGAVTQKLRDTAFDLGATGHDNATGYGRADALSAVETIASTSDTFSLYSMTGFPVTYTVDSTGDGADSSRSDGVCDDGNGSCTLRAAIGQANAGTGAVINFSISGGGARTISPASALPTVTKPVFIDGYSQPGASVGTVLIELDGAGAGTNANGLTLSGKGSHVRGLAVNSFDSNGIVLQGSSGGQALVGNMIGTDTAGSTDEGNGVAGVYINGAPGVVLRDNVISGNTTYGVHVNGAAGAALYGNKVGTNAAATSDLGNTTAGVHANGAREVVLRYNVISGNDTHGVSLAGSATGATIEYNRIGTNDAGNTDLGNTGSGIHISGTREAEIYENVIGFNDSHGISLTGGSTYDTIIAENHIGANSEGTALGNGGSGVHIGDGARNNAVVSNTIANNGGDGVTVVSDGATGNWMEYNSIHDNTGLGIDLGDDGATANDADDTDSGPNSLQNYPTDLTYAHAEGVVSVIFNVYRRDEDGYSIDFYACDTSTSGEGKQWLAAASAATRAVGSKTSTASNLTLTLAVTDVSMSAVTHVTATSTPYGEESTSEFAPCVAPVVLPELVISKDVIDVTEGSTATYTVALSPAPSAETVVKLLALTYLNESVVTVLPDTLTFAASDSTAKTVTVTGVADDDAHTGATEIWHEVVIGDYQHVTARVPVEVADDDAPRLTLTSTTSGVTFPSATEVAVGRLYDGSFTITEGETATYTIQLTGEPEGDTTVSLEASDTGALTASPTSITFTKTGEAQDADKFEWDDAQTVTLTALADTDAADEAVDVVHEHSVDGEDYTVGMVRATVRDSGLPRLTFTPADRTVSVNEGGTATYSIGLASDPGDGDTATVSVSISDSATTGNAITVMPASLAFTGGTSGDWNTAQDVTVTGVPDDDDFDDLAEIEHAITVGSASVERPNVRVTVVDGNRAPFFEEGLKTTRLIDENSGQETAVGEPVVATDLNNDTLTYSIESQEGGPYTVDSGTGQIGVGTGADLNYESGTTQEVSLKVTDEDGLSDAIEVAIEITDVDEPPDVSGPAAIDFVENRMGSLGTYTAADPEGGTAVLSLSGTDGDDFTFANGTLRFSATPNFEAPTDADGDNAYEVIMEATDGDNTAEHNVTVTVTNEDEAGTLTLSSRQPQVGAPFTATLTDIDGQLSNHSWTWERSQNRSSWATITAATGGSHTPVDEDLNHYLRVGVEYIDGHGPNKNEREVADLRVQAPPPVNHAPEFPAATAERSVAENSGPRTTVGARVQATDANDDELTYTLSGADADSFEIDRYTGQIRVGTDAVLNSEDRNRYFVTVTATDPSTAFDTIEVTITIDDVNEPPVVVNDAATTDEDTVVLIDVLANDEDPEQTPLTVTISSRPRRGSATVDANNLVTYQPAPDSHGDDGFTYRATDGALSATASVSVTVNPINDPPAFASPDLSRTVTQNAAEGARVGAPVTARDVDGDDLSYLRFGSGASLFDIDPDTAQITVAAGATLELGAEHMVMVTATDPSGASDTATVTITVTTRPVRPPPGGGGGGGPVSRPPVFEDADGNAITETRREIEEGAALGAAVGEPVVARDPDEGTLSYTLSGDDASSFAIDASTGQLRTATELGHGTQAVHTVVVTVTDPSEATAEIRVTITVIKVGFDCSSGDAAPEAGDNGDLAADGEALLSLRDLLAGSAPLNWSENIPIGQWDGVRLHGTPQRVTGLYLPRRGLNGCIPADLGRLSGLRGLYLHHNELTGQIPSQLGQLSGLSHLTLHRNRLSGELPAELGDLNALVYLSLYGNELTGGLPQELGGLSNLRWLDLHSNRSADGGGLSGPIPATFGKLGSLERLLLYGNRLSGAIPAVLGELSGLRSLLLHDNEFSGPIPTELGNLSGLRYLWLDDNDLTGRIPGELGRLDSLRWLSLYGNNLSGPIPTELGNLSGLRLLILDRNALSGAIPARLGELTELTWLDLNDNELSGPIPGELGELSNLEHMYLHDNDLTGRVPAGLGDLSSLTNLWLRDNRLSGRIPASLGELPNLQRVRISGNAFTGCVPGGLLGGSSWYSDAGELGLPACGS